MPSRKKAQGQARKAEKEKQAREQAREQARALQRASCKHSTILETATQDDLEAANSLLEDYVDRLKSILRGGIEVNIPTNLEEIHTTNIFNTVM
jgi:replicative DNA helicase